MDFNQVFFNPAGRLRSGWRLLVFAFLYYSSLFLFETGTRIVYAVAIQVMPGRSLSNYLENFVYRLIILAAALIAGFICTRWLEGLPWRALGLSLHEGWLRDFLIGSVFGIASLALATLIATAGGGLSFTISGSSAFLQIGKTLVFSGVLFVVAALAEEAFARGYPLQTMTRAGQSGLGVLITSLAFAGSHFLNPNFSLGLPFLNLLIAGVWFGVAYLRTRSLWFPLGIHWAWNWALGSLFGLPVSGLASIAPHPLVRGTDLGPAWLTGGAFGIEGGIAGTAALIISTIFVWRTKLVSATEEMKRLTSQENALPPPAPEKP